MIIFFSKQSVTDSINQRAAVFNRFFLIFFTLWFFFVALFSQKPLYLENGFCIVRSSQF